MEPYRATIHRRRDGADHRAALRLHGTEEALVKPSSEPAATLVRRDADEMDVGLRRARLRPEAGEEPAELTVALGREAGVREVLEEQPGEHAGHMTAAPPVVDDGEHHRVVSRAELTDQHGCIDDGPLVLGQAPGGQDLLHHSVLPAAVLVEVLRNSAGLTLHLGVAIAEAGVGAQGVPDGEVVPQR